jgi:hypothetical protein
LHDHRSQSPVKKSRALSTPAEVDEIDNEEEEFVDALEHEVPTPSPHPSPPHETTKTRQLSQGADDTTNLRNGQSTLQDTADPAAAPVALDNAATPDVQPQIGTSSLTPAATIPEMLNQTDIVKISLPSDVAAKSPIEETAATASMEHATAPSPAAAVPTATDEVRVPDTTPAMPIPQFEAQCTQKIDNQTSSVPVAEARADSNTREVKRPTPPLSEGDCPTKRPRDDGEVDPNPRETKRASPPPEIENEKEKDKDKDKDKKEKPARKKSVVDAHAQSTPASPRATPASAFVGCLCRCLFQAVGLLICS